MPSNLVNGNSVEIPEAVINWLFNVIQPIYHDPRRTFHDSVAALSEFKQLRPRTRVFTNSNGASELLLCMYGKLELGSPLPVLIWLPLSYPIEHPLLFIDLEAATDSRPSVGPFVTADGEIRLPMLDHWHPEISNLSRLIEELTTINFRNGLLLPVIGIGPSHPPSSVPGSRPVPDLPSRPTLPPIPPRPTTFADDRASPNPPRKINNSQARSNTFDLSPPRIPERPPVEISADLLDTEIGVIENNRHADALEHLRQSIQEIRSSSSSDAHEKLETRKAAIRHAIKQFEMTLDYERATLQRSSEALQQIRASLGREVDAIQRQTEQIEEYERTHGDNPDPSAIISTENAVVGQLYRLVARDYALSEAINTLSRLFSNDVVKLDTFVKKTRGLAREQFLTRLHMQRAIAKLEQH